MAFTKIHHHGFSVGDMDQSIHFYRDLLGLELIQDVVRENLSSYDQFLGFANAKIRVALFTNGADGGMIELVQYRHPPTQFREQANFYVGASHVSFQTTDLYEDYKRLTAGGVRFKSPPIDIVREGKMIGRVTYALDPDEIPVELFQPF